MWQLYKLGGLTPAISSVFGARNAQQMAFIRSLMKEQRKHSLYEVKLETLESVVFDLETTGFSPYHGDEIISFGGVRMIGEQIREEETYYKEVNPGRSIPKDIVLLTGITNEKAAEAPSLIDGLQGFLEFAGRRVLIAHASGHDKHFLNAALWKTSRIHLHHRLIDTMMIAKWLRPKQERYDLDALLADRGIRSVGRHHALRDSLMTAKLWREQLLELRERGVETLGDLYAKLSLQG
jgi:DNA polymerase-3 subunit epsilon